MARVLSEVLAGCAGIRAGHMFGFPAYYAGRRLFACVYGSGVGIKLPAARAAGLLDGGGGVPFRPYGRPPMRHWVELRRSRPEDYRKDRALLLEAAAFAAGAVR